MTYKVRLPREQRSLLCCWINLTFRTWCVITKLTDNPFLLEQRNAGLTVKNRFCRLPYAPGVCSRLLAETKPVPRISKSFLKVAFVIVAATDIFQFPKTCREKLRRRALNQYIHLAVRTVFRQFRCSAACVEYFLDLKHLCCVQASAHICPWLSWDLSCKKYTSTVCLRKTFSIYFLTFKFFASVYMSLRSMWKEQVKKFLLRNILPE